MFDGHCMVVKEGKAKQVHLLAYDVGNACLSIVLEHSHTKSEEVSPADFLYMIAKGKVWAISE